MMVCRDISFDMPEKNILFDDLLLNEAESGRQGECLRFWESPVVFIVLGRIGKAPEDLNVDVVKSSAIPVLRRSSGGGTVVQGPGCLNYSLILRKDGSPALQDIRRSYEYILAKACGALAATGVDCRPQPISDIALETGRKISGNAQKRGRGFILHHGTLLCGFDLSLIERYLAMPKEMPEYRKGRAHRDFVANLDISSGKIKTCLKKAFGFLQEKNGLSDHEERLLQNMLFAQKVSVDI